LQRIRSSREPVPSRKSYLKFSTSLKAIDIATTDAVGETLRNLGIEKDAAVRCRPDQVHIGLHYTTLTHGVALEIDEDTENCPVQNGNTASLVVIEDVRDNAGSIVAVNYASSVKASIKVVAPLDRRGQLRILRFPAWKDNGEDATREALFAEIDARIASGEVAHYQFVTMFTDGLPYTVRLTRPAFALTYTCLTAPTTSSSTTGRN
jgi:hypothetical protein